VVPLAVNREQNLENIAIPALLIHISRELDALRTHHSIQWGRRQSCIVLQVTANSLRLGGARTATGDRMKYLTGHRHTQAYW